MCVGLRVLKNSNGNEWLQENGVGAQTGVYDSFINRPVGTQMRLYSAAKCAPMGQPVVFRLLLCPILQIRDKN